MQPNEQLVGELYAILNAPQQAETVNARVLRLRDLVQQIARGLFVQAQSEGPQHVHLSLQATRFMEHMAAASGLTLLEWVAGANARDAHEVSPEEKAEVEDCPVTAERLSEVVGARLRAARVKSKLRLQQLSEMTGVSLGYLSQIELGKNSASLAVYMRIADGLHTTIADITRGLRLVTDTATDETQQE